MPRFTQFGRLWARWARLPPGTPASSGPMPVVVEPIPTLATHEPVAGMTRRPFDILERRSGEVLVTATIEVGPRTSRGLQLGRAMAWAVEAGINLERAGLAGADCSGRDLTGARLEFADLSGATLAGARLAGARLRCAMLAGADLQNADLNGADLAFANLRGAGLALADLTRANLSGARLHGASFLGARLVHANLATPSLGEAEFGGADLAGARARDRAPVTRPPIAVRGLGPEVVMLDRHMRVGNEIHPLSDWAAFEERLAERLGASHGAFWRRYGKGLLDLAHAAGRR